jgi:phenylacetate-CoA ligase
MPEVVARLNELQPDALVAYASMIRTLADEQLAGRLRIAPRAVNSSSEVLTPKARALAERA